MSAWMRGELSEFEARLAVGDEVEARFTNNHRALRFRGKIVKLNARSARVASLENNVNGWAEGHVFVIPRFRAAFWSQNNGLFPAPSASDIRD